MLFPQESQFLLWAVVPSSAMQCKAKFKAVTCLKFSVFTYFFQDASSVILVPNAFKILACFGHAN